jgi:hypothetical protein
MHRAQACPSKILNKKWETIQLETHQRRLRDIKKTIVISEPKTYSHMALKPKRV